MDRRITWLQPEQLGRATDLWTQIINETRDGLKQLQVSENMTAKPNVIRNQDFIPLTSEYQQNGNFYDEKSVNAGIPKRKDNIASTYDWNSSGKLKSGGTPWRVPGTSYEEGVVGLHQEIQDFYKFMFPRPEEHVMRQEVVARVAGIINSIWPEAKVEIYGSCKTQLYLPTSDIDLVVFGDLGENPCCQLGDELQNSDLPEAGTIKVLDKASVPIVKLTDRRTRVRVDISFNMKTTAGCASLIANFIVQFPNLPYLVFVLKQFLLQRDLNEVWTGGISSYSLILMIVSFLQLHVPPEPTNLGVLLIEFFELYGLLFNYIKTGISVENGGSYFPKEKAPNLSNTFSLLCIEDPMNPYLDLGRNSYGFMKVRNAFGYAYRVLSRAVLPALDQDSNGHSILGRIIRVTDEVVDQRKWVQQTWAQKAQALYQYPFSPVYYGVPQPQTYYLPQEDTALRIARPVCPAEAPLQGTTSVTAPEGAHQEDNSNQSAMTPTAATGEPTGSFVISSSSSGEVVSSSSDSESEMSSQTSGSSTKDIDSAIGLVKEPDISTAKGKTEPSTEKTLKNEPTNALSSQSQKDADKLSTVGDAILRNPPHKQLVVGLSSPVKIHKQLPVSETITPITQTTVGDVGLANKQPGPRNPNNLTVGKASPTKPQQQLIVSVASPMRSHKQPAIREASPTKGCNPSSPASSPHRGASNLGSPQKQSRPFITPHIEVTVSSNNKSEIPASLPRSPRNSPKGNSSPSRQPVKTTYFRNKSFSNSSSTVSTLNIGGSSGIQGSSSGSSGGDSNNNGGQSAANKRVTKVKKKQKKEKQRGAKS